MYAAILKIVQILLILNNSVVVVIKTESIRYKQRVYEIGREYMPKGIHYSFNWNTDHI